MRVKGLVLYLVMLSGLASMGDGCPTVCVSGVTRLATDDPKSPVSPAQSRVPLADVEVEERTQERELEFELRGHLSAHVKHVPSAGPRFPLGCHHQSGPAETISPFYNKRTAVLRL